LGEGGHRGRKTQCLLVLPEGESNEANGRTNSAIKFGCLCQTLKARTRKERGACASSTKKAGTMNHSRGVGDEGSD